MSHDENFGYVKAGSLAEAMKALSVKGAGLHAGGTDLLGCLRDEIIPVDRVVSIAGLKELRGISSRADGGLKIGALTVLADVMANPSVVDKYPVLAQAAASVWNSSDPGTGTIEGISVRDRDAGISAVISSASRKGGTCYALAGKVSITRFWAGPLLCRAPVGCRSRPGRSSGPNHDCQCSGEQDSQG
jgi:xanthine dehydrogenase YagS FAD-binding subunit